jgi:hypothetical protein
MPDISITTKQETSEVILPPGSTGSTSGSLSSLFDKIVEGKNDGKSAAEVIAEQPKKEPEEKKEVKTEVKPEVKTEVKPEEKSPEVEDLNKKLDDAQTKKDEGEVDRNKLREATEVKEEKPEVKTEEKKEDEVPEAEMKVLPSDKPKTAKRIQALLRKVDEVTERETSTKKERDAQAAELADLRKKLTEVKTVDPTTDAKVKEQLDELAMYRRRYELDKDPEVKSKYDSRVESAEKAIHETLKRRNAGEPLLKLIEEEGGWAKFSESTRLVSVSDGEGGTKQITTAELADNILQALPLGERKSVEAAMMEQVQTKRDKDRYIKEQQEQAVQFFKKREEEATKGQEEYQRQLDGVKKTIDEFEKKTLESDWLKDKTPPANATAAEKAAVEEHNKYNAQLRAVFKKSLGTKDINELLTIVGDSVKYYDERRNTSQLKRENDRLRADLAAKQAELDKFKGAGRSVPKAGSIATNPTSDNDSKDETPRSITEAFDRIQRGERLGVGRDDE